MAAPVTVVDVTQDEVLTGEAVALDVQPIGFFLRVLGGLIDIVIAIVVYVLLVWAVTWLAGVGLDSDLFPILSIVLFVIVAVALPVVVETAARGRSIGRLAVGGRIVRADGGASGLRQALIRALVGVFEIWMTAGAVAAVVAVFTPRAQRLGDLVAGTFAERTRTPPLAASAPVLPPPLAGWADVADVVRLPDRLARRCAAFVRQAQGMDAGPRGRVAAALAGECAAYVSPVPPIDPETFVRGVVAVRYERELRALRLEDARVAALTTGG